MTEQEYRKRVIELMSKFVGEIHNELVDLTTRFVRDNIDFDYDKIFTSEQQRQIEQMALTAAWVEDRLNGLTGTDIRNSRKSRTKKIGKALGCTY